MDTGSDDRSDAVVLAAVLRAAPWCELSLPAKTLKRGKGREEGMDPFFSSLTECSWYLINSKLS